ncbi:MAG: kynureninase [Myxococcota bacterium]
MTAEPLDPEALRPHYASFLREGRILLTGHSHQAWPDVAREGLLEAFEQAAAHVDAKWGPAYEAADALRAYVAEEHGGRPEDVALATNSHELQLRFLSALDLRKRPRIVTTDGEFHSLRRQLTRLEEEGLEVTRVPAAPVVSLAERLAAEIAEDVAALMVSSVLFETSALVPDLAFAIRGARAQGAEVLLDAYHHTGIVPWADDPAYAGLPADVFVSGGGYKYLQWGEGCCFLRVPPDCTLRPVFTGWFSDFANLEAPPDRPIGYGETNADRFAGSTYDPASHFRARRVLRFFEAQGLTLPRLRATSLRQTGRILEQLAAQRPAVEVLTPPERRGGFVTVRVPDAPRVVRALRERGVYVDARGDKLRFGPAPYVTDAEIDTALAHFRELTA